MLPALRRKKGTTQIGSMIRGLNANRGVYPVLFQA